MRNRNEWEVKREWEKNSGRGNDQVINKFKKRVDRTSEGGLKHRQYGSMVAVGDGSFCIHGLYTFRTLQYIEKDKKQEAEIGSRMVSPWG